MRVAKRILDVVRGVTKDLHGHRQHVLIDLVAASLSSGRLTLTDLGRHLPGKAYPKHKIKRADRAVGNSQLAEEAHLVARQMAGLYLTGVPHPCLMVDWTKDGAGAWRLSASIAQDGRSLLLYEEMYPKWLLHKSSSEQAFLKYLHTHIVPRTCRPVVLTDRGFQGPWFQTVRDLGWFHVGPLAATVQVRPEEATSDVWMQVAVWSTIPRDEAIDRGQYEVGKTNPQRGRLVTFHGAAERHKSQKRASSTQTDYRTQYYRERAKKPWVLMTNLPASMADADSIVELYRLRMQCEEAFREGKSERYGLGMNQARSTEWVRRTVLHLVARLAHLASHIAGVIIEQLGHQHRYQANTLTARRVLSLPRLGREALRHADHRIFSAARIQSAITHLRGMAQSQLIPA